MSQSARSSTSTTRTDGSNRPTKPSDALRPYFYTTFQSSCCGEKVNSTSTTQNKNILPIPEKFKTDAEKLLNAINEVLIENLTRITKYTSVIPDKFFEKNDNYQIQRFLIDRVMLRTFEEADIINRMTRIKPLYPIRTSGNGNCLLHAALIAMIGIHDCNLYLRDRLAQFMDDNKDLLKTHWKIERVKSDKAYGITTEDSKLDNEWKELCDLVHYEKFEDGQIATHLEFLEAVHIFSLSNMLLRPIIVLSEDVIRNKNGEAISVNDLFGIYLPILTSPNECIKIPIVLAYDRSHFCPLQTTDNRDTTSDNILPLYPSINHILEQSLLPIRFLGDDVTADRSKNLLHDYLQIRTIEYTFDKTSPSLPVLCANLGTKTLSIDDNFFHLYYKYVEDFFEIQKPKAIEEERQRELDEYISRDTSYDTNSRPLIKQDTSPTKSPRSMDTTHNIPPPSQSKSYERQYPYDDTNSRGGYVPYSNGINVENIPTQPQQSQRPPDYAKATQQSQRPPDYVKPTQQSQRPLDYAKATERDSRTDSTRPEVNKEIYPRTNVDNINNINNNGKVINTTPLYIEENVPRLETERQRARGIPIPVHVVHENSSSNGQNVTNQTQRRTSNTCLLCYASFNGSNSADFCPKCDYAMHDAPQYREASIRPTTGSRSTNLYLPAHNRGHSSVLAPTPKTRTQYKVICPYCRNPNVQSNLTRDSEYWCSSCKELIPPHYRY